MPPTTVDKKKKPSEPHGKKKKFRVASGSHAEMKWVPATEEEVMAGIPGLVVRPDGKHYRLKVTQYERGQDVTSEHDLDKEFNAPGSTQPHFIRVGMNGQPLGTAPNPWDYLESKSVEQLKALAIYEEIDIGDAKTKEQLIKVLTDYRDGVGAEEQ